LNGEEWAGCPKAERDKIRRSRAGNNSDW